MRWSTQSLMAAVNLKHQENRQAGARNTPFVIRWRNLVFSENGLSSTTKLVLVALSLHMNGKGGSCFPSIKHLSDRSSLSEKAICEHLKTAEECGWILRSNRIANGKGWRRKSYQAVIPEQYGTHYRSIPNDVPCTSTACAAESNGHLLLTCSASNSSKELINNSANLLRVEEQIISKDSNPRSAQLHLELLRLTFSEAYEAALLRCLHAEKFTINDVKIFCEIENNSRLFGNIR